MSTDVGLVADCCSVHSWNITSNLTPMLKAAGLDWADYEREDLKARELLLDIATALARLADESERFRDMDPMNGWGSRDILLGWLARLAVDCIRHPDAIVSVSR